MSKCGCCECLLDSYYSFSLCLFLSLSLSLSLSLTHTHIYVYIYIIWRPEDNLCPTQTLKFIHDKCDTQAKGCHSTQWQYTCLACMRAQVRYHSPPYCGDRTILNKYNSGAGGSQSWHHCWSSSSEHRLTRSTLSRLLFQQWVKSLLINRHFSMARLVI